MESVLMLVSLMWGAVLFAPAFVDVLRGSRSRRR
jgi:hypothetical protein